MALMLDIDLTDLGCRLTEQYALLFPLFEWLPRLLKAQIAIPLPLQPGITPRSKRNVTDPPVKHHWAR